MPNAQVVSINGRDFTLAKLKLGQLRQNDALREAVAGLQALGGSMGRGGQLPNAEQFTLMLTIAHASAQTAEPTLTFDEFAAAVDAEDFDRGFLSLAECVALATYGAKEKAAAPGALIPGEAERPSSSTSADSTGSLPPQPDGGSETSTT